MKQQDTRQNQEQPDSQFEKDEKTPNLSIADKCAVMFNGHRLGELILEIDNLSETVSRIVGAKVGGAAIPITPADELAKLLFSIRDEIPKSQHSKKTLNTLDTAIELAFLHSTVYKDAYEVFMLDLMGKLYGASSAYEVIHGALLAARDGKKPTAEPVKIEINQIVYRLCDYKELDLDFLLKEGSERAFEFQLVRNHRDSDEIFFNTFGERDTSLNRNGYKFPLNKDATDFAESLILTGSRGKILFLGYKDTPVFALSYTNTGGEFEGHFIIYGANGESIQALALFEEGVNHD